MTQEDLNNEMNGISIIEWKENQAKEKEELRVKLGYNKVLSLNMGVNRIQISEDFKIRNVETKYGLKAVIPVLSDEVEHDLFCNSSLLVQILNYHSDKIFDLLIIKSEDGEFKKYEVKPATQE